LVKTTVAIELDIDRTIGLLADAVRRQRCVLFLGAGVHAPPGQGSRFDYPADERPPLGAALSEQLARDCEIAERMPDEDPRNLQRVALFYEIAHSRRQLVEAVAAAVQTGKRPSPLLGALAELDFPLVISTNYDHLFERALATAGKQPRVSIYTPELEATTDFRDPTAESPVVFKIHGDISRPETIVVTDEDYIQFVLRMSDKAPFHPVPETFLYRFKRWPTLFIGYSLIDYNLRLLFKAMRVNLDPALFPETYSIDPKPDQLIVRYWSDQRRYVRFVMQDVWSFVPALYELIKKTPMPA
jgi:hypothetical protein